MRGTLLPSEEDPALVAAFYRRQAEERSAKMDSGEFERVDLAKAATLAQRILSRNSREFDDEANYLARAVLAQGAILERYEARIAELEGGRR